MHIEGGRKKPGWGRVYVERKNALDGCERVCLWRGKGKGKLAREVKVV